MGSFSTSKQVTNYNFGGTSNNQEDTFNGSKYQTYQPSVLEKNYQTTNYSSSLNTQNASGVKGKGNLDNDFSYNYATTSYGNTGVTS